MLVVGPMDGDALVSSAEAGLVSPLPGVGSLPYFCVSLAAPLVLKEWISAASNDTTPQLLPQPLFSSSMPLGR